MDRPPPLPSLTGFRGVAAYAVLLAHSMSFASLAPGLSALSYFGMSLFFILSGFVIQYNYGRSFAEIGYRAATRNFFVARFARLYPLYFVGLVLSVSFVRQPAFVADPRIALSCLTLTQSWFNVFKATGDIIIFSWSISTEFFFYLLFIPLASSIDRLRYPQYWLGGLLLAGMTAIAILALNQARLAPALDLLWSGDPKVSADPWLWLIYFSPFVRMIEYFAGTLAARIIVSRPSVPRRDGRATWITAACIGWCSLVVLAGPLLGKSLLPAALLPNLIFAPAIVTAMILACRYDTFLTRAMASRPLQLMGEISYSVYLLQSLVFVSLASAFAERVTLAKIAWVVYAVMITTALGYGVYHLFEAPMRSWVRRMAGATRQVPLTGPADGMAVRASGEGGGGA